MKWEELHARLAGGGLDPAAADAILEEIDSLEYAAALAWYQERQQLLPTPLVPPEFKAPQTALRRD